MSSPAPTPSPVTTYPFDPTGLAATNKIVGERQVLNQVPYNQYSLLIPLAAPFFAESMSVTLYGTGGTSTPLVPGVDYVLTHYFIEATRSIGKPIYGSVTFYNNNLTGVISFNYQTLGGTWTLTETQITEILANIVSNPRITTWEQITDLPNTFPPINHVWDIDDMVNMDSVVAAINDITAAIGTAQSDAFNQHITNYNNPHLVTAAQVGLGNVLNYGTATMSDAVAGVADNLYITPAGVAGYVGGGVGLQLTNHIEDVSNPHNVTAAQIGLGNVPNYPVATLSQAQAGTDNASLMTPALVSAALTASGVSGFAAHVSNYNNPHEVTAAQVGLGLVQNYSVATQVDSQSGSSNALYMTPLQTAYAITAQALGPLNAHTSNLSNPHQVTAAQVGAYSQSQVNGLLAGYQTALGYTPVRQGGGTGQGTNTIYIGWNTNGTGLSAQVDTTSLGTFLFSTSAISESQVTGLTSDLAGKLSTTGTAANSNNLGGQPSSYYAKATDITNLQTQINNLQNQINQLKGTSPTPAPAPAPAPTPTPTPTPAPAPAPAPTPTGGGGGCVGVAMYLKPTMVASSAMLGDSIDSVVYAPQLAILPRTIQDLRIEPQPCYHMVTTSGCEIIASDTTPMVLEDGTVDYFQNMLGKKVLVDDYGVLRWEDVITLEYVGVQYVVLINIDNQNFFAGEDPNRRIATHNGTPIKKN